MVGPGFALVLIYPITKPTNCKCILTIVTLNLRKRVLRHQANKNFHTYFAIDNVCNNISENRRK